MYNTGVMPVRNKKQHLRATVMPDGSVRLRQKVRVTRPTPAVVQLLPVAEADGGWSAFALNGWEVPQDGETVYSLADARKVFAR